MERSTEKIPTWALCALINDDWSGLNDADVDTIIEWINTNRLVVMCPADCNEYYTSVPAFGLPCMVMDCICESY